MDLILIWKYKNHMVGGFRECCMSVLKQLLLSFSFNMVKLKSVNEAYFVDEIEIIDLHYIDVFRFGGIFFWLSFTSVS